VNAAKNMPKSITFGKNTLLPLL
jgi:hypothetical protein